MHIRSLLDRILPLVLGKDFLFWALQTDLPLPTTLSCQFVRPRHLQLLVQQHEHYSAARTRFKKNKPKEGSEDYDRRSNSHPSYESKKLPHHRLWNLFFYFQLEKSKNQKNLVSVMISAAAISKSDIILIYHNFLKISLIKRVKGYLQNYFYMLPFIGDSSGSQTLQEAKK